MMRSTYRRSPRLAAEDCLGPSAAHVIFVTRRRGMLFANAGLASVCLESLRESGRRFETRIVAYCIMPDHAHFLVQIPEGASL